MAIQNMRASIEMLNTFFQQQALPNIQQAMAVLQNAQDPDSVDALREAQSLYQFFTSLQQRLQSKTRQSRGLTNEQQSMNQSAQRPQA